MKKKHSLGIIIIGIGLIFLSWFLKDEVFSKDSPSVVTVSSIEKIVETSELSTYTAVYNGIAEVKNPKSDQTDYFVSYESRIKAGINFEDIQVKIDEEAEKIKVILPNVYITETTVDIATLDFIFFNEKANRSTVIEQAYKAAEEDVESEATTQETIYGLAEKNAKKTVKAIILPLIEQSLPTYILEIE